MFSNLQLQQQCCFTKCYKALDMNRRKFGRNSSIPIVLSKISEVKLYRPGTNEHDIEPWEPFSFHYYYICVNIVGSMHEHLHDIIEAEGSCF